MFELLPFEVLVRRVGTHALPLPHRASAGAAGYDLRTRELIILYAGESRTVGTGFAFAIPAGHVGLIRDRSGLAVRGLTTRAGVIDSDYRGEISVVLVNETEGMITCPHGERIAQLLILPIATPELREVAALDDTARGEGGFGHTGRD